MVIAGNRGFCLFFFSIFQVFCHDHALIFIIRTTKSCVVIKQTFNNSSVFAPFPTYICSLPYLPRSHPCRVHKRIKNTHCLRKAHCLVVDIIQDRRFECSLKKKRGGYEFSLERFTSERDNFYFKESGKIVRKRQYLNVAYWGSRK